MKTNLNSNSFVQWVDENLPKIRRGELSVGDGPSFIVTIARTPYERAMLRALVATQEIIRVVPNPTTRQTMANTLYSYWIDAYQSYKMEKFCDDKITTDCGPA